MPLLDIEKQLFVCSNKARTIQITVKNAGTGPLELRDVFPIGECRDYIHVYFNNEAIKPNDTTDIEVTIDDYWKPAEIQFDTNCPRTGKIIYVLRPANFNFPNLWLFPSEKYNRDQVFFHDPEPHLQLPIIVRSNSENPLEIDFCPSVAPCKIAVYCGKTGREINHQGNERRYQIVNTQNDYRVHSACIYFSQDVFQNGYVAQEIQLKICTNSKLKALREQKISIQLTKLEVTPEKNLCLRLRKENPIELELKNSGPHPLRIFGIPTDLDKIEVEYLETDNEKTQVSYPIVIQKDKSKKLGITIKSSFKEWLWSGIDLSNVSIPIYANTVSDPQSYKVSRCKMKMEKNRNFWIGLVALVGLILFGLILFGLILFGVFSGFFQSSEKEVIVSSYPHGQTVRVDGEEFGTTPTLLKVKENARIQIGSSDERQVKDVQKEWTIFFPGSERQVKDVQKEWTIFFPGSEWKTGKGESK